MALPLEVMASLPEVMAACHPPHPIKQIKTKKLPTSLRRESTFTFQLLYDGYSQLPFAADRHFYGRFGILPL